MSGLKNAGCFAKKMKEEMQGPQGANIKEGSFVELRGRPWLVEELRGKADDLQTLSLSCITDDAQGERIEVLWDAEIGANGTIVPIDRVIANSTRAPAPTSERKFAWPG